MPYPGYLLNPGDMFQVDMERVLFATGAPKSIAQVRAGRRKRKQLRQRVKNTRTHKVTKKAMKSLAQQEQKEAEELANSPDKEPGSPVWQDIEEVRAQRKEDFNNLLIKLEKALTDRKNRPGAKRKQAIRALRKEILGNMRTVNRKTAKTLDDELNSLLARMSLTISPKEKAAGRDEEEEEGREKEPSKEYIQALREAMQREQENAVDDSKPYATPWQPRPYMSAFAFIPRYLEVNHKICSAVYLRHPVARPNLAEVPSPFPPDVQQLAFNWYLRRR